VVVAAVEELRRLAEPIFLQFGSGHNTPRQDWAIKTYLEMSGQPIPPYAGAGAEMNALALGGGGQAECTELGPGAGKGCHNVSCEGLCLLRTVLRWSDFKVWTEEECVCWTWLDILILLALLIIILGPTGAATATALANAALRTAAAAAAGGAIRP
jgi:hypothetical protein